VSVALLLELRHVLERLHRLVCYLVQARRLLEVLNA
jgi:hypothetical protein